jgi:hypothetical protein
MYTYNWSPQRKETERIIEEIMTEKNSKFDENHNPTDQRKSTKPNYKNHAGFFREIDISILKFLCKHKGAMIAKTTSKKNEVRSVILYFRTYY